MNPRNRRRAAALVAAVGLVAVALVPMALAGSADDPEIDDECESAGGPAGEIDTTDIRDVWFEIDPRGKDRDPRIDNVVVAFCNDPDSEEFRRAALAGWNGWRVTWTDEEGTQWEVRAWIEHANNMPTHRTLEAPYFQEICRKLPGQSWSSVGSQTAEYQTSETNPGPEIRAGDDALALGLHGGAGGPREMTGIHALGGMFNLTTNLVRNCSTGWADTADRAPDDGFADPIVFLAPKEIPGITLGTPDDHVVVPRGQNASWTVNLTREIPNERDVTLHATADEDLRFAFEERGIELMERAEAATNLTVEVPLDTPMETIPVTVRAEVVNGTGLDRGQVSLQLNVTVIERLHKAEIVTVNDTIPTVAPGNRTTVPLRIDNLGSGSGLWNLSGAGPTASWLEGPSSQVELAVDGSEEITAEILVPEDASTGAYEISVVARSVEADFSDLTSFRISVHEFISAPAGATMASVPGAGPAAVALALLGAALLVGRRR